MGCTEALPLTRPFLSFVFSAWDWQQVVCGGFPTLERFCSLNDGAPSGHRPSPTSLLVPFSNQKNYNRIGDPRRQGAPLPGTPSPTRTAV